MNTKTNFRKIIPYIFGIIVVIILITVGIIALNEVKHACDECDKIYGKGKCNLISDHPGLTGNKDNNWYCSPNATKITNVLS